MADSLEQVIRRLAGERCEYCKLPDGTTKLLHVLDHVIARQHGGQTIFGNLALCCPRCNQFKGPNISGIDPETGLLTRLFHPRNDRWESHFQYHGVLLAGLTDVGKTTVNVLAINLPLRIEGRGVLRAVGLF